MRPTHGRISCQGVVPLAPSFDTIGWFARDAALLQRIGEVLLADRPPAPPPPRLLIADDAFALVDETSQAPLQRAVAKLATMTQAVEHIKVCQTSWETWYAMELILKEYEVWQTHGAWIRSVQPKLAPDIEKRFMRAATVSADKNEEAQGQRAALRAAVLDLLREDVVLCVPTAPGIAPLKNTSSDAIEKTRRATLSLTCLAGLAGLPQVTLPLAQVAQCPLGLSFLAAPGRDIALLSYAQQVTAGFSV